MRITSELWVSALIRRANSDGAFVSIVQKGAKEAGAIFVVIARLNGTASLLGPAMQMAYEEDEARDTRRFSYILENVAEAEIAEKLAREKSFDPDLWIVEIEDRDGRTFMDDAITD